jgi:hypothetical protein
MKLAEAFVVTLLVVAVLVVGVAAVLEAYH